MCIYLTFRSPFHIVTYLPVSLSLAFNKMVSVNGQDFSLQLVDTAGQVYKLCYGRCKVTFLLTVTVF